MSYVDPCPAPAPKPFSIEAVVICVDYHDFLRNTLGPNKHLFDRIVVVTSYEDKHTQKICEYNHVQCIRTDVTESRKGHFRKGAAINVGLAELAKDGWVMHLDADIALPPQTRILLERAELDPTMIYGIDRFNVKGYAAWEEFLQRPRLQHECDAYIHPTGFPIATRVMSPSAGGYVPIGFAQLFSPSGSGIDKYPEGHTDAGREDMLFAKQWPRAKRGFLPEIIGYHLESEDSSMMANWSGRKTAPFEHHRS